VERVETCRGRNEQRVRVEYAIIIDMVQLLRKYNSCDLGRIVIEVRAGDARNIHTHARARARIRTRTHTRATINNRVHVYSATSSLDSKSLDHPVGQEFVKSYACVYVMCVCCTHTYV